MRVEALFPSKSIKFAITIVFVSGQPAPMWKYIHRYYESFNQITAIEVKI